MPVSSNVRRQFNPLPSGNFHRALSIMRSASPFEVRRATEDDLRLVNKVRISLNISPIAVHHILSSYKFSLVAESNKAILGYVTLRFPCTSPPYDEVELEQLFVSSASHRNGVGSSLLDQAEHYVILSTAAKRLILRVSKEFKSAQSLYLKSGYLVTKQEELGYHMAKQLVRT